MFVSGRVNLFSNTLLPFPHNPIGTWIQPPPWCQKKKEEVAEVDFFFCKHRLTKFTYGYIYTLYTYISKLINNYIYSFIQKYINIMIYNYTILYIYVCRYNCHCFLLKGVKMLARFGKRNNTLGYPRFYG